jgi:hypothetical protein
VGFNSIELRRIFGGNVSHEPRFLSSDRERVALSPFDVARGHNESVEVPADRPAGI